MRAIRTVLALAVLLSAAVAVHRFAYLPLRADIERRRLEAITFKLWEAQPMYGAVRARENLVQSRRYLDRGVHNTGLYMVAAANYRILDDPASAAAMYRAALRYDRRPELYFNLGRVELDLGHLAAAKDALVEAGLFNPYLILEIPDDQVRFSVEEIVAARRYLPWRSKS